MAASSSAPSSASSSAPLLVELFVEELPPKALQALGTAFADAIASGLKAEGLVAAGANVTPFATPRRLAVLVDAVEQRAPDRSVSLKLMPVSVGLSASGEATPALLKKLAAVGADVSALPALQRRGEGKAEALHLETVAPGATLRDGLQRSLDAAIAVLPIPKVMQYQLADGWTSVSFVRPAHRLVALHGEAVVAVQALGLEAGRTTEGHRFEAEASPVELRSADAYAGQLREEGAVIAGFAERRAEIARQLAAKAGEAGLAPIDDAALLDEVTALVERPNVLVCRFDRAFLDVPPECLVLTMKANQKYFPLLDAEGRLTDRFLVVSNITPADPSRIVEGNERVVRPRLADARFFFDKDRRQSLESRLPQLAKVVYHGRLGSLAERVVRVRKIAAGIAAALGDAAFAEQVDQAARLAKADLLTDMVGEFPELQGTMGRYYALHDGLSETVAFAIEDHYKPRFAGGALPRSDVGTAVALADKLETLVGMFFAGEAPTGDKDPYALRRHALGMLRMLIDKRLPLEVGELLAMASRAFAAAATDARHASQAAAPGGRTEAQANSAFRIGDESQALLHQFLCDRLSGLLRERGFTSHEIDAVLALAPQRLAEIPARLSAVRSFAGLAEAPALAAANKRVANILKKAQAPIAGGIDPGLLREPAEIALAESLARIGPEADAAFERGDYAASLRLLAALKQPVDAFFDAVMVNAADAALRDNRLGLLTSLSATMNRVADIARLTA